MPAGSTSTRALDAIDRAVRFLAASQADDGELPSVVATRPDMSGVRAPDTNSFTTPQVIWSLSFVDHLLANDVIARAASFVASGEADGAWRFFTSKVVRRIEPDNDTTACAAAALRRVDPNFDGDGARARLAAHRDDEGRFLTWLRDGERNDIDSVANANVHWLLGMLGDEDLGAPAAAWLLGLVRDGADGSFPYYETPLALYHAVSRAIFAGAEWLGGGTDQLVSRAMGHRRADGTCGDALETAFALLTLLNVGRAPDEEILTALLGLQHDDGSWPDCAAWNGPEWPAPRSMWWGGPVWTTALATEAVARCRARPRSGPRS